MGASGSVLLKAEPDWEQFVQQEWRSDISREIDMLGGKVLLYPSHGFFPRQPVQRSSYVRRAQSPGNCTRNLIHAQVSMVRGESCVDSILKLQHVDDSCRATATRVSPNCNVDMWSAARLNWTRGLMQLGMVHSGERQLSKPLACWALAQAGCSIHTQTSIGGKPAELAASPATWAAAAPVGPLVGHQQHSSGPFAW